MSIPFDQVFPLRRARVHEVYGPGAMAFAAVCCAAGDRPVIWVREGWQHEQLNPVGLSRFFDPARLLIARAPSQTDALAVTEEALRDGSVPLVVVELSQDIGLTEGRRLQLAAKQGKATGLCLIAHGMGSNAAETRWHATPVDDPAGEDSTLMRWDLKKNKSGTLGVWDVRWTHTTHRLDVVSPVGQRPGS
jgi:protein ImuA